MRTLQDFTLTTRRRGSSLTEVLIAMMVIGIGGVSILTLFSVAATRAIKANHVTQATTHRYNAETSVGVLDLAYVELFYGPNRLPGNGTVTPPFPLIDPGPNGEIGSPTPDYDDFERYDIGRFRPGRHTLDDYRAFAPGVNDDFDRILIDPLGFYRMGGDMDPASEDANIFGKFEPEILANVNVEPAYVLPRVTGGHRANNTNSSINYRFTESESRNIVTLPDQYSTLLDSPITDQSTPNSVTLPAKIDGSVMSDIASAASIDAVQVVLFDSDGSGHVRELDMSAAPSPLPVPYRTAHFKPALPAGSDIERAVFRQRNSDFTWMISARTGGNFSPDTASPVEMDVVIFFKRAYSDIDERVFYTRIMDSTNGSDNPIYNKAQVSFSGDPPAAKKGGFLFDTQNNRWYRILDITIETDTRLEMILENEVIDDDSITYQDGSKSISSAFMRGVVEVFPLGRMTSGLSKNPPGY